MSVAKVVETPVVFDCQGDRLLGVLHCPETPRKIGLITLIAGGPQYRGGVGRNMVSLARVLGDEGFPVLRFDYRGMGDSEGEFLGFEHVADDLRAAVETFVERVPTLERVVIWGGCDAAAGAMIHAWKVPQVHSLVLANPWVYTPKIASAARNQHYLERLRDPTFWKKLLRMEYNLLEYLGSALRRISGAVSGRLRALFRGSGGSESAAAASETFVDRMLNGLSRFEGPVLFVLSGQSIVSKEFDELLALEPGWREVYEQKGSQRVDLKEADQSFSTDADRVAVNGAVLDWVKRLDTT